MATPAPGTIPALPPYQPAALPITGLEAVEIVSSLTATSAASFSMLITDLVGKAPSALPGNAPVATDVVAFWQKSTGLPFSCAVASLATGTTKVTNIAQVIVTAAMGTTYTPPTSVREVYVSQATTVTVSISAATAWFAADTNGLPLVIADGGGNGAADNITIHFLSDTCNGTSTLKIITNYGGYRLRPLSTGNWVIV
jgi:hypothetical protein